MESVENHENQNSEKATNDPLYKKGPQKNREKGNRQRHEVTGRKPLGLEFDDFGGDTRTVSAES